MRHPPAHDTPRIGVDDEGRVGEPPPRRHIGQVRHPQRIRAADLELPIHPVIGALALHHRVRGLRPPAPHRPLQPQPAHQPSHRATRHRDPFTAKLAPDLAHPVHPEGLGVHPADLPAQPPVAAHPPRRALRLPFARLVQCCMRDRGHRRGMDRFELRPGLADHQGHLQLPRPVFQSAIRSRRPVAPGRRRGPGRRSPPLGRPVA